MRRPERIPIFLREVDLFDLLHDKWSLFNNKFTTQQVVTEIKKDIQEVERFWNEVPDFRFSQLLIHMGFIPNCPGTWYYWEESKILNLQGIDPAKYRLWGQCFDKDMNELPKTIYKPICELDSDHIKAILKNCRITENYGKVFEDELKKREENETTTK